MRNNAYSQAMDLVFGSTQDMKRLAAEGRYDELEAMEKRRRAMFDAWMWSARANVKKALNHQAQIPEKARSAGAE